MGIKSESMSFTGHACMGKYKKAYTYILGRQTWHRLEDDIKMDLEETESVDWIQLT
jgi:hypothetical protein